MEEKDKYIPCPGNCLPKANSEDFCNLCKDIGKILNPQYIICNLCAGPMCPRDDGSNWNMYVPAGLLNAEVEGEYNSYHLFDLTKYKFNFCEKCLRDLFNKCKIPPITSDSGGEYPYEKDKEWYEYRLWKDDGGHHNAYINKLCNFKKNCPNKAIYTILNYDESFSEECRCDEHKLVDGDHHYYRQVKFIPSHLKAFL